MKRNLILLLASLAPAAMMAKTLTLDAALQRAFSDSPVLKAASATAQPRLLYTQYTDGHSAPAAYVLSRGDSGFMVLAADDVAAPVLGYSDEGTFDPDNIPENMAAWLAFYAEEIAAASRSGAPAYAPASAPRADRAPIAPLIKTLWNQNAPYNDLCPTIGSKTAPTGCVATAMAQVMYYHQWPQGTGEGTGSVTVNGTTLSMDYSQTTFDWDNMLLTYSTNATTAQKQAVATLMKACGYSVDMKYGANSSGASLRNTGNALFTNFGYSKAVQYLERDYYSIDDWTSLIYSQLNQRLPVLYSGKSASSGHAFVCDGYSTDGFFHINWGWGGMSDGYFLLTALTPSSQGIGGSATGDGYNSIQAAIINIRRPGSDDEELTPLLGLDELTFNSPSAAFGSSVSVTATNVSNISYVSPLIALLGVAFVDKATGERVNCMSSTLTNVPTGYYYAQLNLTISLPDQASLPEGEYEVVPTFCMYDGGLVGDWMEMPMAAGTDRTTATVTSSEILFNALTPKIETTSIEAETLYKVNASKITVTIANTGGATYYGNIAASLRSGSSEVYRGDEMIVEIQPGQQTVDYYITVPSSVAAGTYSLVFVDKDGSDITPAPASVTVATAPELKLTFGTLKVVGSTTAVLPQDVHMTMDVTCTSFKYQGTFLLYIFPYLPGQTVSSAASIYSDPVDITAGETKTVTFRANVPALAYDTRYFCQVYYNNAWVANQVIFTTADETTGIADITPDDSADILSETYYTLQGTQVHGAPAPGIYVKVTVRADGSRSATRVMIK